MTEKQIVFIQELHEMLLDVHLDKSTAFPMVSQSSKGESVEIFNREKYLEFIVNVAVEQIGECFSELLDD